ncbi:MAG: peptidylprolyl isomerase [Rickettsiales bacterium]|nr:peptidylprolyl isomerase [Rickettsiales bacterium]
MMAPAYAAEQYEIGAVVNEDIITKLEIQDRLKLTLSTTGLSDSPQVRRQLLQRIVQNLIDESLQEQEAKRFNIAVGPDEVEGSIGAMEQERGRPAGSLIAFLEKQGVPARTFRDQLAAQIAWSKLVGKRIRRTVNVSGEEIDGEIERRMNPSAKREELLIASLVLPVDSPESEDATRELAKKLRAEIDNGANFDALATQLAGTQASSLEPTWVDSTQLDPLVAEQLSKASLPGYVGPIRGPVGFQILQVKERRETIAKPLGDSELSFRRILLSLDENAESKEVNVLMDIAKSVRQHPGSCQEKGIAGLNNFEGLNIKVDYTRTRQSGITPEIKPIVQSLHVGEVSAPFASPEGIQMLMLCEKTELPMAAPDRDKIREQLLREKLALASQKYIRDLRRAAFIDIRLRRSAGSTE